MLTDDSKISLVKCLQGRSSQVVYDNSEKAQNAEFFKCQLLALRFYSIVASEYAHGSRLITHVCLIRTVQKYNGVGEYPS